MAIEPYILIPSSALAILFMIAFIRLMAGPRSAYLTEHGVSEFLSNEEPGAEIRRLVISEDRKYALVELKNKDPLRLIRTFGDKFVMQSISIDKLQPKGQKIYISRQDISHPAITFQFPRGTASNVWINGSHNTKEIEVTG